MTLEQIVQESFDAIEEYYHDKKGDAGITFDDAWWEEQIDTMIATNALTEAQSDALRSTVGQFRRKYVEDRYDKER